MFENSRIMSSKLQYFRISGAIPSGPAALPSVSRSLTLLYSSGVKGPVFMLELFPLMVLIPVLLGSYSSLLFPSNCLKCPYHLVTRSSLLLALILPLFEFFRPVILLISFQLSACLHCSFDCSTSLTLRSRISASILSYSSCRDCLA